MKKASGTLQNTQHFTTNYSDILYNINFKPESAIDPFAGNCDLVKYSENTKWELYDIDIKNESVVYNDSLLHPVGYTGKSVITNPPYLAKNKTKYFSEVFRKYHTDDLYKASILSIVGCKNGILIIPLNFFTDENTSDVRTEFLSRYKVSYVNFFTRQVFDDTTYNVCSFYFEEGKTSEVIFFDFFDKKTYATKLDEKYGFRVGGEFYDKINSVEPVFTRLTKNCKYKNTTSIFVSCLDKRRKKIYACLKDRPYIGKNTDRVFCTLTCKLRLEKSDEAILVEGFNKFLAEERKNPLLFTNYRDNGRKRISFDCVYRIFSMLYNENIKKNNV